MTTATISYVPADTTDSVADLLQGNSDWNPAAWDEIIRRCGTLVSTAVLSFRLQEVDALDTIQMTWLRLVENAHRLQFPKRLGEWLTTIACRKFMHILREAKLGPNSTDVVREIVSGPSAGSEQRAIGASTTRTLRKLIDELSPRRRTLIRLLFTDDHYSYAKVTASLKSRCTGSSPRGREPCNSKSAPLYVRASVRPPWCPGPELRVQGLVLLSALGPLRAGHPVTSSPDCGLSARTYEVWLALLLWCRFGATDVARHRDFGATGAKKH